VPTLGIAADFVLIVVAGLIGGIAARAVRLPLLVGYVVAGIFVGPYTAGPTVVGIHEVELLAEIGAALLLFSLGLEVSFGHLRAVRRVALIGGPIQVLATTIGAALACTFALGIPLTESLWFGALVALSSTMVVVKTLHARGVTTTLASRVMIGILLVQDLSVIPMLIVLPQLRNLDNIVPNLGRSLAIAAAFLAAVYFLGTRLLPPLLRAILQWGSEELFLDAVVAAGIGTGFATHAVGLSFALGAFVAGITLSESELAQEALGQIAPLRDIFGLLFFVTVGMLFDPRFAWEHIGQITAAVAAIFVGKAVILGVLARAFGYIRMAPWIIALGLAQMGEFSFVLARTGSTAGFLSKSTYDLALACTIVTMALSPVVSSFAIPIGRAVHDWRAKRKEA